MYGTKKQVVQKIKRQAKKTPTGGRYLGPRVEPRSYPTTCRVPSPGVPYSGSDATGSTTNNTRKEENKTQVKLETRMKPKEPTKRNIPARHTHDRATFYTSVRKRTKGKSANKSKAEKNIQSSRNSLRCG